MIDFRYHLISIISVLLALSLGILVGSGFLGDPLLEDIKKRTDAVNAANDRLLELASKLRAEIRQRDESFQEAAPLLLESRLTDRQVVMFVLEGTPGGMIGEITDAIEEAGGAVATTIRVSDRFRLETPAEQDQLALILRALPDAEDALRAQAGTLLGSRAASVAALPARGNTNESLHPLENRLMALLDELADADYISVESGEEVVPRGAVFAIVGGSKDDPPFEPHSFVVSLGDGIAENQGVAIAAEPSDSIWELVEALRDEPRTVGVVATVDNAESIFGQIAIVLGLQRAELGIIDHYGTGSGATRILPEPESGT